MRREPSLTLRGALAILGHQEPRVIGKLDKLLGGVILAAGAGAGLAALGVPALAPLAAFASLWGWAGQKNEAVRLLRQALNGVSGKLMGTSGYERYQLIAAAHTTIVIAAFFESFHEHVDEKFFEQLQVTDAEKKTLVTGKWSRSGESIVECLYSAEIPAPSPTCGYQDNISRLSYWLEGFSYDFGNFLVGLEVREKVTIPWPTIVGGAIERYRSHYLALAATVPEFMVWAMLGEHAATRAGITDLRSDMTTALDVNREALARVEALLALQVPKSGDVLDLCSVLERANRGVLNQPIVPMDAERYGTAVEFPTVGQIYINPRYRIVQADDNARPTDEKWWDQLPSREDLDLTLAAYVMAPDAHRIPLLLLGHPGAGKSLLTKVFAARLPASAYTVVRVPLRQVGANAPIMDQVQQALDLATNRRIDWWRLAEQGRGTVRVVLLDGLDELLQATSSDRSGYLQEVMEFQRREAEQEQPVMVVVTSRTVVADRVDIPAGTTVIKLDYFNEEDIEEWLSHWRRANASLIASGTVGELTAATALRQPELAKQPLLLLMLALYSADPASPALDADLSTANLYQRLLDNFARREVAKKADHKLRADEMKRQVQDQLERLSVAALAMFNRGRQDITEDELGADLAALDEGLPARSRPAELGQRLIGEFFFVHAAEAQPLSALKHTDDIATDNVRRRELARRCYEFLHATFGEFLVASRLMNEIVDVAEIAFAGRRGPREPEDDLLFALLSHQPLAARQSIVSFAIELFANLSDSERSHTLEVLETLVDSYHHRYGSERYASYQPTSLHRVRQLAAYSANLVTLRLALEPDNAGVPLAHMFRETGDVLRQWRLTANLWRSGLDTDGLQAMLTTLTLSGRSVRFSTTRDASATAMATDIWFARLVDDARLEDWLRFGMAIRERFLYIEEDQEWANLMASWLIPYIAGVSNSFVIPADPPSGISARSISYVAKLIMRLLKQGTGDFELEQHLVELLFRFPSVFTYDTNALAAAVIRQPKLVRQIPALQDPAVFGGDFIVLLSKISNAAELWRSQQVIRKGYPRSWNTFRSRIDSLPKDIRELIDVLLLAYLGETHTGSDRRIPGQKEPEVKYYYCPVADCGSVIRAEIPPICPLHQVLMIRG